MTRTAPRESDHSVRVGPLRVFVSYRRLDALAANDLERQFAIRGLRLWRDVNDLPLGGTTPSAIRRGVRRDSSAFILYATRRVFSSPVIWGIEVPEALARMDRGHYPVVPVLRRMTSSTFRAAAKRHGQERIADQNAAFTPPRGVPATARSLRAGHAAAARRLLRTLLATDSRQVGLLLRTFDAPRATDALLDVNWSALVDGATPRTWQHELLPALRDVRAELARAGQDRLDVTVLARIGAALAFGMVFPLSSAFHIVPRDRQGPWPRTSRLSHLTVDVAGNRHAVAVLELSITNDLANDAHAVARRVHAGLRARLVPQGGATRSFDPRPCSGDIARLAGDAARALRQRGARDIHVVLSCPAALALLIGRQLHAVGMVHAYYGVPGGAPVRAFSFQT